MKIKLMNFSSDRILLRAFHTFQYTFIWELDLNICFLDLILCIELYLETTLHTTHHTFPLCKLLYTLYNSTLYAKFRVANYPSNTVLPILRVQYYTLSALLSIFLIALFFVNQAIWSMLIDKSILNLKSRYKIT